jgi:ubiquinone/menaquinone biosynthesis C-methylase UbiE
MKWENKALIQNVISKFPSALSNIIYFQIQKRFGNINSISTWHHLSINSIRANLKKINFDLSKKTVLEIGTGRSLNIPILLWLYGAGRIITVDKNKLLKSETVFSYIDFLKNNLEKLSDFLDNTDSEGFKERLLQLLEVKRDLDNLFQLCNIQYIAPGDAAKLPIGSSSVDLCLSLSVLEHIPTETIKQIFIESKRVLKPNGYIYHDIDLTDHFSHTDSNITSINFLKFSEKEWAKYSNNPFAYHNRLRVYDYSKIFENVGLNIIIENIKRDEDAINSLKNSFVLDSKYLNEKAEDLVIGNMEVIAKY